MGRNFLDNPVLLIVLILLIVMIFGAKRLPDAARGLGRSMRIFKSEVKEMRQEDDRPHSPAQPVEGRVLGRDDDADASRDGEHRASEHRGGEQRGSEHRQRDV